MRRVVFAVLLVTSVSVDAACGDAPSPLGDPGGDGGLPNEIAIDAGPGTLSISTSPLALVPPFSPTTYDYDVRCAAGSNPLTLAITDASGTSTSTLDVAENQAIVVGGQYWIRCLPHDFPSVTVTKHGTPTPGWYLVNSTNFAIALDTNGTPVWYARGTDVDNVASNSADTIVFANNGTAPYGTSALTRFEFHALDTLTTTTLAASGNPTDVHELQPLPNGDYLLFSYPIESGYDLSGLSTFTANETIADCQVQEVDPSGNLVWSWLASEHIDAALESIEPAVNTINGRSVVDVFHCNAIDVDASGNLLVSSRHTNALFYVDRATGKVQWKLGGAQYNLDGATYIGIANDPQGSFNMQHDARFAANGNITLFDDHGAVTTDNGVARGVEYSIDHTQNVATMVWQYLGSAQSQYEGSFRRYADGESVIGWGYIATDPRVVTEVDANGNDVFDVSFDTGQQSYRAVKVPAAQLDVDVLRKTAGR